MKFYYPEQYQADCQKLFLQHSVKIKRLFPEARVEHIGASSIPLAISKGDLDIFVGVDADLFERTVEALSKNGFDEKSDTLRTADLCMLESVLNDGVALQVVANGSRFECFLNFRNILRSDPALVESYNGLKTSWQGKDPEDYRDAKSRFINDVLAQA